MFKLLVLVFIGLTNYETLGSDLSSYSLEPELAELLENDHPANILITLSQGTAFILESINRRSWSTRTEKLVTLVEALEEHAGRTQGPALRILAEYPDLEVKSLWISNQILVRGIRKGVLSVLVQKLKADIGDIRQEPRFPLFPRIQEADPEPEASTGLTWGVQRIESPAAWALIGGNKWQNVIVGQIDTGVRATHEAVRGSFIGKYGWHDGTSAGRTTPYDDDGHGTHTMGSIVGSVKGIGVAPGAKWVACKGCGTESCLGGDLIACGQWMLCPKAADGTKDCTKAPLLVSNSWGGGSGNRFYQTVVDTWVTANIVPVFAIGNAETSPWPTCYTAGSPGDYANVIGVGAISSDKQLAGFSSRGPTLVLLQPNRLKPDLSGPGVAVYSSFNTSDTAYATFSGTSMAAPHVSGAVALMFSAKRTLTVAQVKACLFDGVVKGSTWLIQPVKSCPARNHPTPYNYPNYDFGRGLLNAKGAVRNVINGNC